MIVTKETRDENGELHSFNDEPAVIWNDGNMYWCKHGLIHRETDAAVIHPNHIKGYWLNGEEYPFHEWIKLTPISEEDKIALLLEK